MALYLPVWRVETTKMVLQELETGLGGEAPFQDVIQFYNIEYRTWKTADEKDCYNGVKNSGTKMSGLRLRFLERYCDNI
jgi:hypothetical protein